MGTPLFEKCDDKDDDFEILNMDFLEHSEIPIDPNLNTPISEPEKPKKKKRAKTKTKTLADGTTIVSADQSDDKLNMLQSNRPYEETYGETNNMLKGSIYQIDDVLADTRDQLKAIKTNKAIRKKYDYMAQFADTMSSLISTKITAIREINSSITHGHDLELKRNKELKMTEDKGNDDKRMMDYYNAFISNPMGSAPLNAPSMSEMVVANPANVDRYDLTPDDSTINNEYNNYMNHLSPQQHMMVLEGDPNVQTVLVYDHETGNRWFDVINVMTGESIPNTDKPSQMIADDCTVDLQGRIARNTNLGTSYPLVFAKKGITNSIVTEY